MAEIFRPRQIGDVMGQDNVKNLVRRSLRTKSFPNFSIMYGPSGSGKSTMAEIAGLSLTCENPDNGEPCCKCETCLTNLKMLEAGKSSFNLCKINMGAIEKTDFKQTIKEVFTLQPATGGNAVYIFEEIQALTKEEQNTLLEYMSNIGKNIYVIACTTELMRLRSELRNRAIKFSFKQLRTDEAINLLNRTCKLKGIKAPSPDIARYLVRSVHNCPREIVNTIDFLANADSLKEEDLTQFLGYVGNGTYIDYLKNCNEDTFKFIEWLGSIEEQGFENVLRGMRDFLTDCYGYIYGANTQYFNTYEKSALKQLFADADEEKLLKLMDYFANCKYDNETSAKYCLIMGRMRFRGKTQKSIIRESKQVATASVIKSESRTRQNEKEVVRKKSSINESALDDILSTLNKVKKSEPSTEIKITNSEIENRQEELNLDEEDMDLTLDFDEIDIPEDIPEETQSSVPDLTSGFEPIRKHE